MDGLYLGYIGYIKVDKIEKCLGEKTTRACSFDIDCSHCRKYLYITLGEYNSTTCIERCTECTPMELNSIALYLLQHPESKRISIAKLETC